MKSGQIIMATPLVLYDIEGITCGIDDTMRASGTEETEKPDQMTRLRQYVAENGDSKKSIRAIILGMNHNHPHVVLLRKIDKENSYILPGGALEPCEDYESGMFRILNKKIALCHGGDYEVVDQLVATWYRPQFTEQMLPYCPVHVALPKEVEEWYIVRLPEKAKLRVLSKYELVWVPFYFLQGGAHIFGEQLAQIPTLLSRFNLTQE